MQKYYMIAGSDKRKCDLKVFHQSVSPLHACWYHHPDAGAVCQDLWSAHGTYIGVNKLTAKIPTPWPAGEKVRLGRCQDEWLMVAPQQQEGGAIAA
eukprot:gene29569-62054_t